MGWDIGATGFRIVLSADVADIVRTHLGDDVRDFLADHDTQDRRRRRAGCATPAARRCSTRCTRRSTCDDGALDVTWRSLARVGNLSSASVLHVLARHARPARRPDAGGAPAPGSPGVLLAMGPGFCSELVLLVVVTR